MSKKRKNHNIKEEKINEKELNEELNKEETSLENIEPELNESEGYKKASFAEKLSLRFRKKLIANRLYTLLLVVLLVAVIWGINAWADSRKLAQIDVTKNHLYSLTQPSKDKLKNLNKDVKIYVYGYTKDNDLVQFLQQYNAFNKKISYEIITETTNYDLITKYGLGTYSALVVTCGDKDRTIYPDYEFASYDYNTGDSVDTTEEVLTNAILKVTTDDPVKVYFATGNGEYGTDNLYSLTAFLQEEVYEVEDLNLLTITEIPSDCDILAIIGPTEDVTETQAELIKNYANSGGNLLVCSMASEEKNFPNLQSVLDLYGVKVNRGLLYEGSSRNYLAYQNTIPLPYVLIPVYSSSNPITSEFSKANNSQMIIMPWSQSLSINTVEEENVSVTSSNILTTSSNCYNIEDYSQDINSALSKLDTSSYTIGSELTRKVKTGENEIESKLVIYANTTFFLDTYKDASLQIATMSNPGNINLIINTFAELGEQENLITVRKAANVMNFKNTEAEDRVVKLLIFGLPILIILIGIIIWNYRRKKR